LTSGIPFHVQQAKSLGARREEVIGALLVGLPAADHGATAALPEALRAYQALRKYADGWGSGRSPDRAKAGLAGPERTEKCFCNAPYDEVPASE
jgi:hypothetical protein